MPAVVKALVTNVLFVGVLLGYAKAATLLLANLTFPDTIFAGHVPAELAPLLVALLNVLVTDSTTTDDYRRLVNKCESVHDILSFCKFVMPLLKLRSDPNKEQGD